MDIRHRRITGPLLALLVLVAGCGSSPSPSASTSATATATMVAGSASATASATADACALPSNVAPPNRTLAATFATALAFAPNGQLFIAERAGTVLIASGDTTRPFVTVPTVTTEENGSYSERGLLGLAISPTFTTDHHVYIFYSLTDYTHQEVVRYTDCAGSARDRTLIAEFPAGADCCHKGGRLAFGPDGDLYVTLGEEHTASAAQNVDDVRGKILRYTPTGGIPEGNPFGNAVWAYGLRNPFGIAFGPGGQLVITMNGPSGDAGSPDTGYDTLDVVSRGERFQWPTCYGYSHPLQSTSCAGTAPNWSSEKGTYVPTGGTYVDASGPSGYAGHYVFCSYEQGMMVFTPGSPHWSVRSGPANCLFDIVEGPNHELYYSDETQIFRVS